MSTAGSPSPTVSDSSSSGGGRGGSSVAGLAPTIGLIYHNNLPPVVSTPQQELAPHHSDGVEGSDIADDFSGHKASASGRATQQNTASQQNSADPATSTNIANAHESYNFFFGPAPVEDPVTGQLPASILVRINPTYNPLDDTVPRIIERLLNPPSELYNADRTRVTLNIIWAIGVVGREHFASSCIAERLFLRPESAVHREGIRYGFPRVIYDWLLNEPEEEELELSVEQLRNTRTA